MLGEGGGPGQFLLNEVFCRFKPVPRIFFELMIGVGIKDEFQISNLLANGLISPGLGCLSLEGTYLFLDFP